MACAVAALAVVAGVKGAALAEGAALGRLAGTVLDVVALAAGVGLYVAVVGERRGALRAFAVPLALAIAVLGLGLAVGGLHDGMIDPKTRLPVRSATAVWAAILGAAEAGLAAVVLASLRPLALHRGRRATVALWRVFGVLVIVAALAVAGRPLTAYAPTVMAVLASAALFAGTALALRQRWTADLTPESRVAAAALALSLAAVLGGIIYVQIEGPLVLLVGDGTGRVGSVPYSHALSRSLADAVLGVLVVGTLYGLASGLTLLFGVTGDLQDERAGERRALRSLVDLSGRLLDRTSLAAAVAAGPVEAGLGDAAWVALTDPGQGQIRPALVAASGIELDAARAAADVEALFRAAAESDGPLVLAHAEADHRVRARPGDGIGSLVALSLGGLAQPGAATRGVLLVSRARPDAFEPDELAALDTFASQAGLSLSHADLFSDALERERLARELTLAREVQQRLLPQSLPEIDGLQLAAAERPAREVGGDYYDAVRLGEHCVGVLIADVSGKGTPAAFYAAELKGIFQAASRLTRAPGELLAGANDALSPSLGRGVFTSASYAVVDAEAGTLTLARAGHTPAVLVRDLGRADGGRWLLRGDGLAIGLDRTGHVFRQTLREQTVHLAAGDTLVLYTDGLTEARDAVGEEYGYDRLCDFVATHAHVGALDLRDLLLAEHRAWSGSDDPGDDMTFVVLRWTGRGGDAPDIVPGDGPPLTERPAFARDGSVAAPAS
ncbi:PP2C family protein-serine/threonine phosphatase [Rubrivirga sp. IMCC43871]|uniref:PP2C family protein-serine/threonine phosphatase n=1 Tax=Rubrivirga sp. IMCC43871 TaxID=3391575 RepID=UPI00399037AB